MALKEQGTESRLSLNPCMETEEYVVLIFDKFYESLDSLQIGAFGFNIVIIVVRSDKRIILMLETNSKVTVMEKSIRNQGQEDQLVNCPRISPINSCHNILQGTLERYVTAKSGCIYAAVLSILLVNWTDNCLYTIHPSI
jgi:hypothetical protein